MNPVQRLLAWVFGTIFLALSVVVSVETLARKLFNYSIQGADELGEFSPSAFNAGVDPGRNRLHDLPGFAKAPLNRETGRNGADHQQITR